MRVLMVGVCWLLVSAGMASSQEANKLAKTAQGILKERCFSCHGESGANEGGFNYALNRKRLVRELVVPGDPNGSKLYERVTRLGAGSMPDGGPSLSDGEIDTLKKWIEADAPSFAAETRRVFITPVEMLSAMLKDLEKANELDRPFYRYFTLTHLYNKDKRDRQTGTQHYCSEGQEVGGV